MPCARATRSSRSCSSRTSSTPCSPAPTRRAPTPRHLDGLAPYLGEAAAPAPRRAPAGGRAGVGRGDRRDAGRRDVVDPARRRRLAGLRQAPPASQVTLEIEANLTVAPPAARRRPITSRSAGAWCAPRACSRKPPRAGHAPSTAPTAARRSSAAGGDRCEYCGQVVTGGRFDWSVGAIDLLRIEERPPALTGTVAETGTDLPTVFHPRLAARWAELLRDDPARDRGGARRPRCALIHAELNAGVDGARPRAASAPTSRTGCSTTCSTGSTPTAGRGCATCSRAMRLVDMELVKVARDRHYDAVTFRRLGHGPRLHGPRGDRRRGRRRSAATTAPTPSTGR